MPREIVVRIHEVAVDGLPTSTDALAGKVAFIHDGVLMSGWPINTQSLEVRWEPNANVGHEAYTGVTHWVEFPEPVWFLHRQQEEA